MSIFPTRNNLSLKTCALLNPFEQRARSYFSVEDIDRKPPAWDPEDGGVVEETGEVLRVQSSAGHQHLQVWSEPGDVFDETKQDVCVEGSLVGLVYDDHTGGGKGTHVSTHILSATK